MKRKKFKLDKKIITSEYWGKALLPEDVKEFIRLLIEDFCRDGDKFRRIYVKRIIKNRAGDKLI